MRTDLGGAFRERLKESQGLGALQDDAVKDWEESGTFLA